MIEPRAEDATPEDLRLACEAIGPKAAYGGLLSCALAGIYAERSRAADAVPAQAETSIGAAVNLLYEIAAWCDDVGMGRSEPEEMLAAIESRLIPIADAAEAEARRLRTAVLHIPAAAAGGVS